MTAHKHYWVDAPDDETGWHCTICGLTKYPGEEAYETLRTALYAEVGKHLTDARVDDLMRQAGIPLHGRAPSVDLQARHVAAALRLEAMRAIDDTLAVPTPRGQECPDCGHPHLPLPAPWRTTSGRLVVPFCGWPMGPESCDCHRAALAGEPQP